MPIAWHHQDIGIGVCQKMTKKKRQKNCGSKDRSFYILSPDTKNFSVHKI